MTLVIYFKKKINSTKFEALNKIFIEKPYEEGSARACIPVFRDILIFKKNDKITGMMKICFNCHQYRILGTKANTDNFGSYGDYLLLWDIIIKDKFKKTNEKSTHYLHLNHHSHYPIDNGLLESPYRNYQKI